MSTFSLYLITFENISTFSLCLKTIVTMSTFSICLKIIVTMATFSFRLKTIVTTSTFSLCLMTIENHMWVFSLLWKQFFNSIQFTSFIDHQPKYKFMYICYSSSWCQRVNPKGTISFRWQGRPFSLLFLCIVTQTSKAWIKTSRKCAWVQKRTRWCLCSSACRPMNYTYQPIIIIMLYTQWFHQVPF